MALAHSRTRGNFCLRRPIVAPAAIYRGAVPVFPLQRFLPARSHSCSDLYPRHPNCSPHPSSPPMEPMEQLCHDAQTFAEARRILFAARAQTGPGSGFDLGGDRTGLPALCAYLASQNLNNTHVTIEAARAAACQSLTNFKKLRDRVQHRPHISLRAIPWMERVNVLMLQWLDESPDDDQGSDQEQICAVFMYVCDVIEAQPIPHFKSFEDYDLNPAALRHLRHVIKTACTSALATRIHNDYHTLAPMHSTFRPQMAPLRALPSRDRSRKPQSPTAPTHPDVSPVPSSLITLQSIRQTDASSSTAKPPPSSSPLRQPPSVLRPSPPSKRRFRPVFLDQRQWEACDPRLTQLSKTADEYYRVMVKLHGMPFQAQFEGDVYMAAVA
ncbi:hypothetical protein B0H17DRAFT_1208799 [Mycena rosella]|uniref:Uncharacterized protein n=1 Tax=Mycena rosella TaxID=1033263 RepID=A0AAD7CZX2_MYCRO|nr:hypothetical protein B0H17DRAFT_1208799 [Mycena rosella]